MADLEKSIQFYQQALDTTPESHPDRAGRLSSIGIGFLVQFGREGQMADLEKSIQLFQQALDATPEPHPDRAWRLQSLGIGFRDRFKREGQMADLEKSIQFYQQALDATPAEFHPDRAKRLQSLGAGFIDRFQREGQMADLEKSIQFFQQALDATPESHPDRAERLYNVGVGFRDRFRHEGQMTDLEKSIQFFQQALDATSESHSDRAGTLQNIGVGFGDRFRHEGQMADLEKSIQFFQQALDATPESHPDRAERLQNVGAGFGDRFQREGQMADLEKSIQFYQQALDATPESHPGRADRLHNIGAGFGNRFRHEGQMADLEKSIQFFQQALDATPESHSDRAGTLQNIGVGFGDRFRHEGQMADLEKSIQFFQQALDATPESHPDRAERLRNIGVVFSHRFQREGQMADLEKSRDAYRMALYCKSSPPLNRIDAGRSLLNYSIADKAWSNSVEIVKAIQQLLPEITPPSHSRQDMQHVLQTLSHLATTSASVILKAGDEPSKALQVLEQGRGRIASLLLDTRPDTSELNEKHPELCLQYTRCQKRIADLRQKPNSFFQASSQQTYVAKNQQLRDLFRSRDQLHDRIREQPGFERFLLPLTPEEIQALARNGPIVCFNVSSIGSEAFLITTTAIRVVALTSLDEAKIKISIQLLAARGNSARRDASIVASDENVPFTTLDITSELKSLWDCAVKPVLQDLNFSNPAKNMDNLPRIWWVGGGIMSLLPLHAAGNHDEGSTENTLSHVVSSYAPTLKALQFIQKKPPFSLQRQKRAIMVVSMPKTPGLSDLNVNDEFTAIQRHIGPLASVTHLKNPTKADVLDRLRSCSIAHFACHGTADEVEPAESALIVGNETRELLTINDLDQIVHESGDIAYLSACSTAEIKAQQLINESIHLASTFQLVGFQHVVGTLWGADDSAAVEVAGKFYEGLLQQDRGGGKSVAQALHDAVVHLRNKDGNRTQISKWGPFIHLGC